MSKPLDKKLVEKLERGPTMREMNDAWRKATDGKELPATMAPPPPTELTMKIIAGSSRSAIDAAKAMLDTFPIVIGDDARVIDDLAQHFTNANIVEASIEFENQLAVFDMDIPRKIRIKARHGIKEVIRI